MNAYVVVFGAGKARRFLAQAPDAVGETRGWRQIVWTRDLALAEKFGSHPSAWSYAESRLPHDRWEVAVAPPRGVPTGDLGGSPVLMRAAA